MADDGFASFYASSYRRLLGQLFAVTGDLPEAWVRRVAINLAAMADRSLRRRARALLRLGPPPLVPELSPDLIDLRDALAALPLGQRQVIVLHHLSACPSRRWPASCGWPRGRSSHGWPGAGRPWPAPCSSTGRR
jgi:RNA polymerase sigma-70 factor (ECF subfamily)